MPDVRQRVDRSQRPSQTPRARRRHSTSSNDSLRPLRRLNTRDIERIRTRDGTLSRLRLGDRPGRRRASTFFHKHSRTVVHDHRRDRFYRITPEGNLRRIENPSVLATLRRREAQRERHEAERRWRAVSADRRRLPDRHVEERHRDGHHRDRHRDWDDDHFFFGFGVGSWYYPYRGFYFGYHRGYYPHYVPAGPYYYADPWFWHYDPFYYHAYYGDWWSVHVGIGLSTVWPAWCVPVVSPAVVVWPYAVNVIDDYNVYGAYDPSIPSSSTYRVNGQAVASTPGTDQLPPTETAPQRPSPTERPSPSATGQPQQSPNAVEPDNELLEEFAAAAEAAFQEGDYAKAARLWRHALVEDPDNGLLMLLMGQALFASGKYREAAGAVQAGLGALDQKSWGVVVSNWRELYGKPEDYTKQLRALEKAIEKAPNDPALRFLVGYHYGFLGYPKEAARELGYLKELAPQDRIGRKLYELMQARAEGKEPPKPTAPRAPQQQQDSKATPPQGSKG